MTENKRKQRVTLFLGTALVLMLAVGIGVALSTARVSTNGAASLSNGRKIKVAANVGIMDDGVAISSYKDTTTVDAGKYLVEFVGADIVVNEKYVGSLPNESDCEYDLVIDSYSGVKVFSGDVLIAESR